MRARQLFNMFVNTQVGTLTGGRGEAYDERAFQPSELEAEDLDILDAEISAGPFLDQQEPTAALSRQRGSSPALSGRTNSVAPEYAHLPPDIAAHLTKLKVRVLLAAVLPVNEAICTITRQSLDRLWCAEPAGSHQS